MIGLANESIEVTVDPAKGAEIVSVGRPGEATHAARAGGGGPAA